MGDLYKAAGLFEVNIPEFKQLKACRKEICMLKTLWDQVELVRSSFENWNTTLWSDINVENMEIECKKFVKDTARWTRRCGPGTPSLVWTPPSRTW